MKLALHLGLCLALVGGTLGGGATPAMAARVPEIVTEQARTVAGGRAVQVLVAQSEIKSDINASILAVATGGGMLGALLASAQNSARTKRAETAIEPLRAALTDFDADALSLETTRTALAAVPWLQDATPVISKDASLLGKSGMLDASPAAQIAFIEYSYDISPDFRSMRVVAKVDFANKAVPAASAAKPESRLLPKNLAYSQRITSVVTLPASGEDIDANAALWSADHGSAARAALTKAYGEVGRLLPRTLSLTAADVAAMNGRDKPRATLAGFPGRTQETTAAGTLLWSPGFVSVQALP